MDKEIAIKVENLSKTFRIPHEKISTLRGAFVNLPRRLLSKAGAFKTKSYEKFKALDDVSFEVKKGEFFGIIGRNGSGKSTLLKILAGIYQPGSGKVEVNGRISPFLELGIGFNPELSGRDNIYLNATVLGLTQKQIDEKFDDIVEFSELRRFIDQKIKNYSSGMQVRLAFSVAVHANRDILLMDEVLAVGDESFQKKCIRQFLICRDQGKTVVLVSHDMENIRKYCDRALLLESGVVVGIENAEMIVGEYRQRNLVAEKKMEEYVEFKKEKGQEKYRTGNKEASIEEVLILDGEEKNQQHFRTGDSMIIRIYYAIHSDIKNLVLGVSIYPKYRDQSIFGFEATLDKKKKCITVTIDKLWLAGGAFFLSVGLTDRKNNWATPYDLLEKQIAFHVREKGDGHQEPYEDYSICHLPISLHYED